MKKLNYSTNKALRLSNVLQYKVDLNAGMSEIDAKIIQMQSYLRTKGVSQVGPLIQYTKICYSENREPDINMYIMIQCNNYIHNVESSYKIVSSIRVPNCMYCRYI